MENIQGEYPWEYLCESIYERERGSMREYLGRIWTMREWGNIHRRISIGISIGISMRE